jgi:hypothetical protein
MTDDKGKLLLAEKARFGQHESALEHIAAYDGGASVTNTSGGPAKAQERAVLPRCFALEFDHHLVINVQCGLHIAGYTLLGYPIVGLFFKLYIRTGGRWAMEASILVLVVGSFACWCAWQCFKSPEKNELEKRKDNDAWREDMHRRFEDVELPGDWAKSIKPSVNTAATRNQASPQKTSAASSSIRSGSSSTVAPRESSTIRRP